MIIYLIAFLLTIFFYFLTTKFKIKNSWIKCIIISLPFIVVSGFRGYNVGIDTNINYVPMYNIAHNYWSGLNFFEFYSTKYSIGFTFILMILSYFFKSPTTLILICSTIITINVIKTILYKSKIPMLSIFIYFFSGSFFLTMNGMRGYLALSLVFYSLIFVLDRKFLKFLICILISASFHSITILFILLYPLYKFKFEKKYILVLIAILPILVIFGPDILSFVLKSSSYSNYFKNGLGVNPLYTMLLINIFLLFIFFINYVNNVDDLEYNLYLKLQVISVVVCVMSFSLPQSYRVEQMVDFFQIISIPFNLSLILKNKNILDKTKKIIFVLVILLFTGYFTKCFVFSDDNRVLDYHFIFEDL